jgi:hypothetical protein
VVLPHIVAISVCLVAIAISVSLPSYLPAAVPSAVIGIVDVSAAIIGVVVVSAAVIRVVIVCVTTIGRVALVFTEARIIAEASLIGSSPFPIFPLALTVKPVVLDIVVAPLGQPLPVIRIVVSVVAVVRAVSGIRIILIAVLCASRS